VLYNIPGRCGAGMTPETIARLDEHENIVGIKEATGSLDQASEIAMRCDITIISGDDSLTLPLAAIGAKGVISVVANIVPADVKAMTDLILEGDLVKARQWHRKLFVLSKNMLTLAPARRSRPPWPCSTWPERAASARAAGGQQKAPSPRPSGLRPADWVESGSCWFYTIGATAPRLRAAR
jgi:hypothetical protein